MKLVMMMETEQRVEAPCVDVCDFPHVFVLVGLIAGCVLEQRQLSTFSAGFFFSLFLLELDLM